MRFRIRTEEDAKPRVAAQAASPKPQTEYVAAKVQGKLPATKAQIEQGVAAPTITIVKKNQPEQFAPAQLLEAKESKLNYAILAMLVVDVCVHIAERFL